MNDAVLTVLIAMLGGAIRVSTPFMFVALGECLTEKSGRVNLGLEGHAGARRDGRLRGLLSHRLALARRARGGRRGLVARRDARLDLRPAQGQRRRGRHRDDAVRRRRRLLLRQALHPADGAAARFDPARLLERQPEPQERACRSIRCSSSASSSRSLLAWALRNTRWGLVVRTVGDSAPAARAMGISVNLVRLLTTTVGGFLAGVGGAFLSLSYPGSWNQGLSSGQGLMAVALVIFARWSPMRCVSRRCCSAPPARSGRRCSRSASRRAITSSTPRPTS